MNAARWVRQQAETGAVLLAWATFPWLPRCGALLLANSLGWVGYVVSPKLRRIADANLRVAFGADMTEAERRERILEAFRTFALVLVDLFWFGRFTQQRIRRYVHLDPIVSELFTQPLARIALTAHLGNWELLGQAVTLNLRPMSCVAAEMDNPAVDRLLTQLRERTGQKIIRQRGALKALIAELGQGGIVALVLDQNTLPRNGGAFVPLFGLPTPLATSAAALALRRNVPMTFVTCIHDGHGHYQTHTWPVDIRPDDTELTATMAVAATLEKAVRTASGQWLWMYKRWKFIVDEASSSAYPFYARTMSAEELGRERTVTETAS